MTNLSTRHWLSDLLLITMSLIFLFGAFLGSRPLSVPDEGRYAEIPREMLASGDYVTPHINQIKYFEKPPFFYWLQVGSLKLFGINEWAARIPNAFMALLGCLATYAAGRKLFDRKTGWFSSAILATNLLYFSMAHVVTLDITVSALLSISLLSFITALQYSPGKQRRLLMYLFYAGAALAVLTKGLIGIVFPAIIIGSWILVCNEWRLLKNMYLGSGLLLFLLIAAPWHFLVQLRNPEFAYFYFIDQHVLRYFTLEAKRYQPFWFWIPITLTGLLPWTAFLVQTIYQYFTNNPFTQNKNRLYLFLWIILIFIFFSFSHSKLIPYILPIFPPLAICIGHYLSQTSFKKGITIGYISVPIIVLLLGISGACFFYFHANDPIAALPITRQAFCTMITIWLIGALISLLLSLRRYSVSAFIILSLSSVLAYNCMFKIMPIVDLKSVKPFANIIKPLLKKDSIVVTYENYFQDLPFYIEQPVKIVNWEGELEFGIRHQNNKSTIISSTIFWQYWHSNKQVFVITDFNTYQKLISSTHENFYPLAKTRQNIIFTNHP